GGQFAEAFLTNFYCDKLFLGVDSFDINKGLSTPNMEEASINKVMISIAREVIAVADSSKFNKPGFALIAPTSAVHTVITDNNLPEETRLELIKKGIKVIIA
ncbi:MAG: DeoR/GlpR transcriptional regulator, partial [Lutibacter sp.]|uniref:DeoR/GlpR family DNA-binding transcription regulator n=1 Tax=Lutibacter sp. TaxID=1925666 RepID=UPI001A049D28|nr:DeoR/GlpR transcriptional regulator [Lutibacter sp.]